MKKVLFLFSLCLMQWFSAQEVVKTNQKADTVIRQFFQNGQEWVVPVSRTESLSLKWYQRTSSLEKKENIQTFVGYKDRGLVATLSVRKGSISGSLIWNGERLNIETSKDGFVYVSKEIKEHHDCGSCKNGSCGTEHFLAKTLQERGNTPNELSIPTDGVLRIYRLALPVSYDYYRNDYKNSKEKVKEFWARTEVFLNELYHRDVSVKFQIVNDDRLIFKTANEDLFKGQDAYSIIYSATTKINDLISEENYDVGMVIAQTNSRLQGLGQLAGVYRTTTKCEAISINDLSTIAHEMGHMFGTYHTLTTGGDYTYYSEPNEGLSVMGYNLGAPRDYFSLISINKIWNHLSQIGYYTDEHRTNMVKGNIHAQNTNIPYGIKQPNTAPIIDIAKIKNEYTIPRGSFFQLHIPAVDVEQTKLNYYAHHTGNNGVFNKGDAKFLALKPTSNGYVAFEKTYGKNNFSEIPSSSPDVVGTYDFWLAVNDADLSDNKNHPTLYSTASTRVKIVEGMPFKITSGYKKKYKAGEKVTLTWSVDNKIFSSDSKVRVLMSDDFGETFKYTLVPSTQNDGRCEITIPNITLGRKTHFANWSSGLGILKIEVIDHIAHDITDNAPINGGFEIEAPEIAFQNLPEQTIKVKENAIPQKANVIATSTCSGNITIDYTETRENHLITRTWTATDKCGKIGTFTQYIYVQQDIAPLSFVENLPTNLQISCENANTLPSAPILTARGGCGTPMVKYTEKKILDTQCKTIIRRTWIAYDECAAPISHIQEITIADTTPPTLSSVNGELPKDITVDDESRIPQQEQLTASDNCSTNIFVDKNEEFVRNEDGKLEKVIYKWTANDRCGNTKEHTQVITIKDATLTIKDVNQNKVALYPNPIGNTFQIKGMDSIEQVKIYDSTGKLLRQFAQSVSYNISELNKGMYLVTVENAEGRKHTFKVIKK